MGGGEEDGGSGVLGDGVGWGERRKSFSPADLLWVPLITIHQERLNRNVCFVGKVERVTRRRVTILPISPAGDWEARQEHYEITDITRIEFGGAYETLLARMGGVS